MNDKQLFYQYISREITNYIASSVPALNFFSGTIVNYIINAVDPYVDLFYLGNTEKLNVRAAGDFVKAEVNDKIAAFVSKYEQENNS